MRKSLITHLVCCLFLVSAVIGCKKEIIEPTPQIEQVVKIEEMTPETMEQRADRVYDIFQDSGIEELYNYSWKEVHEMMKQAYMQKKGSICYDTTDLLNLIAEFGSSTPDYIPTWNNYFQDANCNVAKWQYFGSERNPENGLGFNSEIISDSIRWNVSGAEVTTFEDNDSGNLWFQTYSLNSKSGEYEPNCGFFQPTCNGGHDVTVTVYIGDAVYERSAISWAQVNNVPEEIAPFCAPYGSGFSEPSSTFDWQNCGCPFVFDEYQFLIDDGLNYDLDGNHSVNSGDLLILLAGFGC